MELALNNRFVQQSRSQPSSISLNDGKYMLNAQMPLEVGRQSDAIFGSNDSQKIKSAPINVEAKFCHVNKTITLTDRNGKNGSAILKNVKV